MKAEITVRNKFLYAPITKEFIQMAEQKRREKPVDNQYSLLKADGSFGGNLAEFYFSHVFAPHLSLNYKEVDNYWQDGIVKFPKGYVRLDVKAKTQLKPPEHNHEQSLFGRYESYETAKETMYAMFLIHDKKNTKTSEGEFEGIYFQGFCFGEEVLKACRNPEHKVSYQGGKNVCATCGAASKFVYRPKGSILGKNTPSRFDNYYIRVGDLHRPWENTPPPKPVLKPFEPRYFNEK